jgi:hypothetical protein
VLRFAGGRELTFGDLGAEPGMLGGINAIVVGNYLTNLSHPAQAELDMLTELRMPIKALGQTRSITGRSVTVAGAQLRTGIMRAVNAAEAWIHLGTAHCARRMVVQVMPVGWSAWCSVHGAHQELG